MIALVCKNCGASYSPPVEAEGILPDFAKYLFDPDLCHRCWGAESAAMDLRDEEERQRLDGLRRMELWERSGLPSRYLRESFETFVQEREPGAYAEAVKWADGFDRNAPWDYGWLVLYSKTNGTGKTHLMAAILRRIIERLKRDQLSYCPVGFVPAPNLMDRLARARRPQSFDEVDKHETIDAAFADLASRRLWAFDDLAQERKTYNESEVADWGHILVDRYNNRLPTIISTNVDTKDLWRYVGNAAADRLREMATVITYTSGSIRVERAKKRSR